MMRKKYGTHRHNHFHAAKAVNFCALYTLPKTMTLKLLCSIKPFLHAIIEHPLYMKKLKMINPLMPNDLHIHHAVSPLNS